MTTQNDAASVSASEAQELKLIRLEGRMAERLPTLFIPHGGGPCFFMDWGPDYPADMWASMAAFLKALPGEIASKPKAILVISGHWETRVPTILSVERNTLLYDYYGFPEHTYALQYPAPGAPEIARRVEQLLTAAGISCQQEVRRGLDHGVFVPFLLIYPDADIPVLQLSMPEHSNAAQLMDIGRALAPLRDESVLIVGSGMTYHNIAGILGRLPDQSEASSAFDSWLGAAVTQADIDERNKTLAAWEQAPFARQCHPTPEHLQPLFVAAGAGEGDEAVRIYNAPTMGNLQSAFRFG